jgi:hypothetical protein
MVNIVEVILLFQEKKEMRLLKLMVSFLVGLFWLLLLWFDFFFVSFVLFDHLNIINTETDALSTSFVCSYCDAHTNIQIKPILSGTRVCLIFNLVYNGPTIDVPLYSEKEKGITEVKE